MDAMLRGYLGRMEYGGSTQVCLDTLRALQRQHLKKIPYENLDMLHKIPLKFDIDSLYEKIVIRRQGGVCYELNFLFEEMLRRMGFSVELLSGKVAGGSGGDFSHALLLVHLPEGKYIADVGFARGYLTPLQLTEGWQTDGRFDYRLRKEGHWEILERRKPGGEITEEYRFTLTPRRREEYREMCDFLCGSPDCKFTYMLVCCLELPEGRLTLRDDFLLMEYHSGKNDSIPVDSPEERNRLLRERFGLRERE